MAKWKLRTNRPLILVAAAVCFFVFYVGFSSQKTQVISPVAIVVIPSAATPVATTIVHSTTTVAPSHQTSSAATPTIAEPWLTAVPTTAKVWLTSYEPRTELEALICDPKFEWDCEEAIAVATCESTMNPRAVSPPNTNGTIDRGLFQINDVWEEAWAPEVWDRIFVARTNIGMAYHAWKVGGNSWKYWTCQP